MKLHLLVIFAVLSLRDLSAVDGLEGSQQANGKLITDRIESKSLRKQPRDASAEYNIDEIKEMTDVHMKETEEGHMALQFKSHGKQHNLLLRENRKQLVDIPINLLGMPEEKQIEFKKELKHIKLMTDHKYRASVAVRQGVQGQVSPVVQSGVFKLGKHEFTIDSHIENRARVVKRYADRGVYKSDGVKLNRKKKLPSTMVDQVDAVVELVMIIDFSNWQRFENDIIRAAAVITHEADILVYFAHIASMMDVAYASMKNPDVKIAVDLAGMVLLTTATELPNLVEDIKVVSGGETSVDGNEALDTLSSWLATSPPTSILPPYDHVMLFTNYDMTSPNGPGLLGIAFLSTICDPVSSCSVTETRQIHTFVADTATHELGHSLGSDHDGDGNSVGCPDENFIMAAFAGRRPIIENRYLFTCCSQRSFWGVLRGVTCVNQDTAIPNYPASIDDYIDVLQPGQSYDADDQCYIAFSTAACDHNVLGRNICHNLFCVDPSNPSNCVTDFAPASDGTECDVGKWCSQGECVPVGDFHITRDQACNVTSCFEGEKRCKNGFNSIYPQNGLCYSLDSKCDGFEVCTDGTDEKNCGPFSCPDGFLKCTNGVNTFPIAGVPRACIPLDWYCDVAFVDCSDGSDEGDFCNDPLTPPPPPPSTTLAPPCDESFQNAYCGKIKSPNSGSKYRNHAECSYGISVPDGRVVQISFKKPAMIEDQTTCSFDSLKFWEGNGDHLTTLCGPIAAGVVTTSTTSQVTGRFSTDGNVRFNKFKFFFKAVCPGPDPITSDTCDERASVDCEEVEANDCRSCELIRSTCCNSCSTALCSKKACRKVKAQCNRASSNKQRRKCRQRCKEYANICGKTCCEDFPTDC